MQDQSPVYPGSAFHPAFGEGEVNGRIAIDPQRLLFTSETANVELSLDGLHIEWDCADRLAFSNPEETDWIVYASDDGILSGATTGEVAPKP